MLMISALLDHCISFATVASTVEGQIIWQKIAPHRNYITLTCTKQCRVAWGVDVCYTEAKL